jgi:thymidylate synthase (FAD)
MVNLIWVTPNAMEVIAFCARVSNPANQNNSKTAPKLLKYLKREHHFSPFEMASACMEITTTRDIARQLLRHRSFSFQEFSQRYADPTKDLDFTTREPRLQDPQNRQNSITVDDGELYDRWANIQSGMIEQAKLAYNWAIDNDIAKEQARAVLPEGLIKSKLYMAGTLRSWMHFVELRTGNGTQLEHQNIAVEIQRTLEEKELFLWN